MGKKEIGELSIVDFIVTILMAEIAALSIEEKNMSIFYTITPIVTLILPIPRPMTNIISRMILAKQLITRIINGRLESPTARSIPAPIL